MHRNQRKDAEDARRRGREMQWEAEKREKEQKAAEKKAERQKREQEHWAATHPARMAPQIGPRLSAYSLSPAVKYRHGHEVSAHSTRIPDQGSPSDLPASTDDDIYYRLRRRGGLGFHAHRTYAAPPTAAQLSSLVLGVKRIYQKMDKETKRYLTLNDLDIEAKQVHAKGFSSTFSNIRQFRRENAKSANNFERELIQIDSSVLLEAIQTVMKARRDVFWDTKPLQFKPEELIAFISQLIEHANDLERSCKTKREEEQLEHTLFFTNFLRMEHKELLRNLEALKEARMITFKLLWSVMVPGKILIRKNKSGKNPQALRLVGITFRIVHTVDNGAVELWALNCRLVDMEGNTIGLVGKIIGIYRFVGAKSVLDLVAFPLEYMPAEDRKQITQQLIERGRRRWSLRDGCHKWYNGPSSFVNPNVPNSRRKVFTESRIIIDTEMFKRYYPFDWRAPSVEYDLDNEALTANSRKDLSDEEYLLTSKKVYGYSLSDRMWLIFDMDYVEDIQWNTNTSLQSIDMDSGQKDLIKILIEQHTGIAIDSTYARSTPRQQTETFDDFVEDKGRGLVFGFHGPPGVGKTLVVETICNALKCPLYVLSPSELGSFAFEFDDALSKIFRLASRWGAVLLIDEADVYLEKRDMMDIDRNALVAVLLRRLEYHTGIVFLTTSRISVFDPAMTSRIDVSMVFGCLTADARERLWISFLQKTDMAEDELQRFIRHDMQVLRDLPMDGREIKNIVKMASALASRSKGNKLCIGDVLRVMDLSGKRRRFHDSGVFKYFHPHHIHELSPAVVSTAAALCSILAVSLWRQWGSRQ